MANILGTILLDQFRVDAFIGSGGTSAVYRVWDLKRNAPLAMKVLHSVMDDPHVYKRFQREASALKKLTHPHIVQIYGSYQTSEFAFLLERYIDGPSLKDILRQQAGRPLPVDETFIFIKAVSSALGYAHAMGVVHCDVKPGNVLIDQGGSIYLTDFDISRHAGTGNTPDTIGIEGTPAYLAPEQYRGESVTPATDVYALGVVLFEMLTGQHPFFDYVVDNEKFQASAERVHYYLPKKSPKDPLSVNPSLPRKLGFVLLKALDNRPENRFETALDFFENAVESINRKSYEIPDFIISKPLDKPNDSFAKLAKFFTGFPLVGRKPDLKTISSGDVDYRKREIEGYRNTVARPLKIFLCHASDDKPVVNELSHRLASEGWIDVWLDEKNLLPGQDWRVGIEEAVEISDIVVICLSSNSVRKDGHVQKEIRFAKEIALEKSEETIFLIPLKLSDCNVPRGLHFLQWANYYGEKKDDAYKALLQSLKLRYDQIIRAE